MKLFESRKIKYRKLGKFSSFNVFVIYLCHTKKLEKLGDGSEGKKDFFFLKKNN